MLENWEFNGLNRTPNNLFIHLEGPKFDSVDGALRVRRLVIILGQTRRNRLPKGINRPISRLKGMCDGVANAPGARVFGNIVVALGLRRAILKFDSWKFHS